MNQSAQNHICAADTQVSINGLTRSAKEWADVFGLGWQALKMRRYRGMAWEDAFKPLRRGPRAKPHATPN